MRQTLLCEIPYLSASYEIEIGHGILQETLKLMQFLRCAASAFVIITDENVAFLYGDSLLNTLSKEGLTVYLFSFPQGEEYKTRETKQRLEDQLLEKKLGRDTCIIAFGGGVVTDVAGYLAATYCRGISLIMIPSSFLGMVDASIGGKVGVNVPSGKNLIGCIYQPKKVLIDPSMLQTLPLQEMKNGIVEMIKHGLIASCAFFEYLEGNVSQLIALDPTVLQKAIFTSCSIKKEIVEEDEKEEGRRRLLNFGHTIGHALERLMNYSIDHGRAVAIGILVESYLALELGHLSKVSFDRIRNILKSYQISTSLLKFFSVEELLQAMALDKKSLKGIPRFVLLSSIGLPLSCESTYCAHVDEMILTRALNWMNDDLCRN